MSSDTRAVETKALVVRVGSLRCALPIACVEETMRLLPCETLSGAPVFVRGVSLIRGEPVPVVDLGKLLTGADSVDATRLLSVRAGKRRIALAVSEVIGVLELGGSAETGIPPLLQGANREMVATIERLDRELLLVLRAGRILPGDTQAGIEAGEVGP